ncbi:hypothetical protein ACHAWF_002605 [Thalassiosira exigua]
MPASAFDEQSFASQSYEDEASVEGGCCSCKPKTKRRLFCHLPVALMVFAAGGVAGYFADYFISMVQNGDNAGGASASNQQLAALPETTETDATTVATVPLTSGPTEPSMDAATDAPTDAPTDFPTYVPTMSPIRASMEAKRAADAADLLAGVIADLESLPSDAGVEEIKDVALSGIQGALDHLDAKMAAEETTSPTETTTEAKAEATSENIAATKEEEGADGAPLKVTDVMVMAIIDAAMEGKVTTETTIAATMAATEAATDAKVAVTEMKADETTTETTQAMIAATEPAAEATKAATEAAPPATEPMIEAMSMRMNEDKDAKGAPLQVTEMILDEEETRRHLMGPMIGQRRGLRGAVSGGIGS